MLTPISEAQTGYLDNKRKIKEVQYIKLASDPFKWSTGTGTDIPYFLEYISWGSNVSKVKFTGANNREGN